MIYNLKNSRSVIYKVDDTFNIEGEEWQSRAPEWIVNAMLEIKPVMALIETKQTIVVSNYKFKLPCELKVLGSIEYEGVRLERKTRYTMTGKEADRMIGFYSLTPNGWGYVDGIEEGNIEIIYKHYPYIFDTEINRQIPLIPDNEVVETALMWYITRQLMYRGYKHPVLTFASNSKDINPAIAWTWWKEEAKRAINRLDDDGKMQLVIKNNSLIDFSYLDYKNQIK